jgi:hypothetical protein
MNTDGYYGSVDRGHAPNDGSFEPAVRAHVTSIIVITYVEVRGYSPTLSAWSGLSRRVCFEYGLILNTLLEPSYGAFPSDKVREVYREDLYIHVRSRTSTMTNSLYRASVLSLYQITVVLGIALLPIALVANRAGIPFPIGRLIERLDSAYERTTAEH